jgi:hypothetical protein
MSHVAVSPNSCTTCCPLSLRSRKLQRGEIEKYGCLYFEYTKLFEDHSAILCQDTKESSAAHTWVSKEFEAEFTGSLPASACSIKQIHSYMNELARRCKVEVQSFDEWVDLFIVKFQTNPLFLAICISVSTGYVQLLLEHFVHPSVKVTFGCTCVALIRCQPQDNLGLLSLWR